MKARDGTPIYTRHASNTVQIRLQDLINNEQKFIAPQSNHYQKKFPAES